MNSDYDFFTLAKNSLKYAEQQDTSLKCAEVFFGMNEYINIEVEENSVKNSEIGEDLGFSIRAIDKRGSLGFAYTNNLTKKSIENVIKMSIKMMKAGTADPDFKNLPFPYDKYPDVKSLCDDNTKNLKLEDSIKYVEDLIKICREDELAISQSADFLSNYSKRFIFNSNGLEINGKETYCSISSNIIVKDKGETSFGFDEQIERSIKNINAIEIAKNALKDAKRNLNRKKIKNMKAPLILTPKGTINLILKPISSAINAETFQYKRCFLIGKREKIIGSQFLNIEDNALIDNAVGSSIFDGEGVPCRNKKIIESGKFLKSGLLHNSYSAAKEGIESTGNASRSSYSSIPTIGTSNFILKPGKYMKEELIEDVKEGILLDYTADSPNMATGDFSGLILHGNVIKNGEIKEGLNETMIGINLLDLFHRIEAISKEFKTYRAMQAPYVKIGDVQIIGSAH